MVRRVLHTSAAVLGLALALGVGTMWIRSHRVCDFFSISSNKLHLERPRLVTTTHRYVASRHGVVQFSLDRYTMPLPFTAGPGGTAEIFSEKPEYGWDVTPVSQSRTDVHPLSRGLGFRFYRNNTGS